MKSLIKGMLRESLLANDNLEEGLVGKGMIAALLLTLGTSWGQLKPEYKRQVDSITKVTNLNSQEKRAAIEKVVQMNRDEISGKKRADFLKTMAAAGFTDEVAYGKYLAKLDKKPDVTLPGLYTSKDTKNAEKSSNVDGPSVLSKLNPFKAANGCIYSDEDKSGVKK
jgi:hypothetical protein